MKRYGIRFASFSSTQAKLTDLFSCLFLLLFASNFSFCGLPLAVSIYAWMGPEQTLIIKLYFTVKICEKFTDLANLRVRLDLEWCVNWRRSFFLGGGDFLIFVVQDDLIIRGTHRTRSLLRAGSDKDDWSLPIRSKLVFVRRAIGQTNEQRRRFNEWSISEFHDQRTRGPPELVSTFVYRGSLHRRKSAVCPRFDMVWLNR